MRLKLSPGQCFLYKRRPNGSSEYQPSEPLDSKNIQRLTAARQEFLPEVYGN
jgi:hypothetical protein